MQRSVIREILQVWLFNGSPGFANIAQPRLCLLDDQRPERIHRRRHAARPEPDRLGYHGRTELRGGGGSIFDGIDGLAVTAVIQMTL